MSRLDILSSSSLTVPPSMISAASPFADPIICEIAAAAGIELCASAHGARAGFIQFRTREQLVEVQAFRRDVGVSDHVRLASVHCDLGDHFAAGDLEVQRRKFERTVLYSEMRVHFLDLQLPGNDLRALEADIGIRGAQFVAD